MDEVISDVGISKKRKSKKKDENSEPSPEKKTKIFCCRTFREELKGSEPLKSLKKFIQTAKNSNEVIYEYVECGGSIQEILSLIDVTAFGDLTTALPVFEAVHLILLRFQSSSSKHNQECIEGAKTILCSHLPIIKSMLSMNITKQKKVALKLLTSIATLESTFANEIINAVALSSNLIEDLVKHTSDKESVRKCFILFLLSFLVEGNEKVLKNLLEKKNFLSSIIPGLKFDDVDTVNLILSLFEEKILRNVKVTKTLKLKLFNTQIVKALFDLFDWRGPQSIKQLQFFKGKNKRKVAEVDQKEKDIVIESVYSFLMLLCCSKKYGISFWDKSLGTSNQICNELLLTVLGSLSDPLKNKKMADVVSKTLSGCPDLVTPVLSKFEPLFQPRSSKNWFKAIQFAENLIKEVDCRTLLEKEAEHLSGKEIVKVGQMLCAPFVFLRVIKSGSKSSQSAEIQLSSLKLLLTLWREAEKLFAIYNFESLLKKPLCQYFSKFMPEVADLIQLWHTLCKSEAFSFSFLTYEKSFYLSIVLDVLNVIVECQKEAINFFNLTSELLNHIEQLKGTLSNSEFENIQVKIVRFMESDLQSLIFNAELFEKSLLILLQSANDFSLSFLSKTLANLDIFKKNKPEIDVWILCYMSLPRVHCPLVAKYFLESLYRCFESRNEVNFIEVIQNDCNGITEPSLTNFIFASIEVLKSHLVESSEDQQIEVFQDFLNDVIIRLQHFYSVDLYLYDHLKGFKKIIRKSVLNYLKDWKQNLVKDVSSEIFSCPFELSLASWFASNEDTRKFKEVIDTKTLNLLQLQSLFKITIAYINIKIKNEYWLDNDVNKFSGALSGLLKIDVVENDQDDDLISYDFANASVYRRKCLNCLLLNNNLLSEFDVFRQKQSIPSLIAYKVFIEDEIFKNLLTKKKLTYLWKRKFLNQLMMKLKKKGSLKGLHNFEKVLNFFDYDFLDILEVIEFFKIVSDLDLFLDGDSPSVWVMIMRKFSILHCEKQELPEEFVKKLCLIMQSFCKKCVTNLEDMDHCFVCLLRSHPRHLLYIDNEFLRLTLQRSNTSLTTHTLGKLLLNDPDKVKYFLKVVVDEVEVIQDSQLLFCLLSVLITNENSFLSKLKFEETIVTWKNSEISLESTPNVYKALKVVYRKFKKNILQALTGEKEELICKNLSISRELVKFFFSKKQISSIQNGILQGEFEPELMFEAVRKLKMEAIIENYMEKLLCLFCRLIRNSKDGGDKDVWSKYCGIVSDLIKLKNSSWENVSSSPSWKEFTKLALGHCFSSVDNPSLLKILRLLIQTFYSTQESPDCSLFFQMTISHSQFLNVILGTSLLKNELVELFYCLIKYYPSEMSPKHIPILLASYNACLSSCDITLLKILRLYEKSKIEISEYEPFVWGEKAVSHYSIGTGRGWSLWQRFNMENILNLLDSQRMETSLKEFPIYRTLEMNKSQNGECDSIVYDPSFILPLFVNLLSPGSVVFCLPFIYKGGLAYTVRALSSESKDIRAIAALVLSRIYNHLELSQNLKQKLVWMHFIDCFRYGIEDLSTKPLPNIATLFFARMTLELTRHPAEMYLPLQNFLLAKPSFAFDTIPEFLPLFCSSEVSYWKHRLWLLEVMRDGMQTALDVTIIFHSMAIKVLFSFFHSQLCDIETKKLTLQVVEKMLRIDKSILLISEYGLLNWIASIDVESYQLILKDLLILLSTGVDIILKDFKLHNSTHSDSFHVTQILNLAVKILPSLKFVKSAEVFQIYLKLMLNCFLFFVKEGRTKWFIINKNRLFDLIEAGITILGEKYNCGKFYQLPFYFREFDDCDTEVYEDLKNLIFVFSMLINTADKKKIS